MRSLGGARRRSGGRRGPADSVRAAWHSSTPGRRIGASSEPCVWSWAAAPGSRKGSPDCLDVVLANRRISGEDRNPLDLGLSYEQSIPRVAMDGWEGAGPDSMGDLYRERAEAFADQPARNIALGRLREGHSAAGGLDRD